MSKKDTGAKSLVSIPLRYVKSTDRTYVFSNEDAGFKGIYLPKAMFPDEAKVRNMTLRMTLTVEVLRTEVSVESQ